MNDNDTTQRLKFVNIREHIHIAGNRIPHWYQSGCVQFVTVQEIVGSWKKFSSCNINKMLNRRGTMWERECFDHLVRDAAGYTSILSYIKENPKALPQEWYSLYIRE